jgi:hypothetical protein
VEKRDADGAFPSRTPVSLLLLLLLLLPPGDWWGRQQQQQTKATEKKTAGKERASIERSCSKISSPASHFSLARLIPLPSCANPTLTTLPPLFPGSDGEEQHETWKRE